MQLAETKRRPPGLIAKKPRCGEMSDSGSFRSNTPDELRCMAMRRCDITARGRRRGAQVDGIKGSRGSGEGRSGDQSSLGDQSCAATVLGETAPFDTARSPAPCGVRRLAAAVCCPDLSGHAPRASRQRPALH